MARADTIPTEISIKRKFEEVTLFWSTIPATADKPALSLCAGRIDGEFEVTYNLFTQDYHISDVWIDVENGRMGDECRYATVNLNADTDERFYFLVLDALMNRYESYIEEWISYEVADQWAA